MAKYRRKLLPTRIVWKQEDSTDYPFLIFDPREAAQHPEKMLIFPVPRTRALLKKHR